MWLASQLLFLWQTGSKYPILEVCEFQFWQCRYFRVYQMQPRNGQNWHSCSHEIGHILPVCLRNNSCRADRINEPHKKNSLIEGEELQHIRYRSRTNDTETKTTFCTSLKLEFISGWVEINSNFREAQNSGFGFRFIRSWALTNARSRLYLIDPSSREHNRAW